MKRLKIAFIAAALVGLAGCTDAGFDKLTSYGAPARIECWSGGVKFLEDESTGKILETADSDGFNYRSKKTGDLRQVNADCVLTYLD
jgi:hypothetical protein